MNKPDILCLMLLIIEDKKTRIIKRKEEIKFSSSPGFHIIVLTARAKSEKQISSSATDDEDLTIQIDQKTFPKFNSSSASRLINSPASINGGGSHNLAKTIYIVTYLENKDHEIILQADDPPGTASFESLEVFTIDSLDELGFTPQMQAEDGDRRGWVTFVLDNISLYLFTVSFTLKRRFIDSDDVKVILDGKVIKNFRSKLHKLWFFFASLFTGENQTATFSPNLSKDLHYIEFYADRMPVLNSISIKSDDNGLETNAQQYTDTKFNRDYNKFDEYIIKATSYWNNFFSTQTYTPPEYLDPNLVKAIIYKESRLGYFPDEAMVDIMQVWDARNPAQSTLLGKTPEREFVSPERIEFIHKFYPEGIIPKVETPKKSIFWGVRWLYHKAQYLLENDNGTVSIPYVRKWHNWKEAVSAYNGNPELVEEYIKEVFSVYKKGIDLKGNTLWKP